MSFRLTIFNKQSDVDQILHTGFIHCEVTTHLRPQHVYRYVFCVHCRLVRSISWMSSHSKKSPFVLTPRLAELLSHSMHVFENDIRSEFELIWDNGKIFARQPAPTRDVPSAPSSSSPTSTPHLSSHTSPSPELCLDDDSAEESIDLNDGETADSVVVGRAFICVEELILKHCFLRKRFDACRFVELMSRLSCFDVVKDVFFTKKRSPFLPMLITSVMRKVFVSLTMTRSQIDTISRLFKCVLVLLSEQHTDITKRIHSNYDSCLRDSWAKGEEKDTFVADCFQECRCFSLALDTALFGQEHIMSCTVRFVFDDNTTQFPLFMALCYASSGDEMASFLLSKMTEKRAVMSKLVSVTTDGASNMIGNDQGLFVCLCRQLRASGAVGRENVDGIKNVWCFAHRMNLVTRDLRDVPGMGDVFSLADWITSRRVAVAYRKFLKARFPATRFRKIQTPSQTRWVFYRDVVNMIITQTDQNVRFVSENDLLIIISSHTQGGAE